MCGAPLSTGCYSTRTLVAPEPGATVLFDLNDRARVALGDRIGPSATRIEGEFTGRTDTTYSVRIASVRYLNGQENRWSGEPFTLSTSFVSQAWQRDFSRARTIGLAAAAAVGLVALIKGVNLVGGSGSGGGGGNPGGGTGGT